jgi:D-glycero-alpha-D-manno-heptose-7-phosphate kinase
MIEAVNNISQTIKISSPTRVDLAGGTLDLWPLYMFVHHAKTINVAIDIYTHVELTIKKDTSIEIESPDLNLRKYYIDMASALQDTDPSMAFYRVQLEYWKPQFGFKLVTRSESPVGGGLGGSSSLIISVMKAFAQACFVNFKDAHEMVQVAHNLEARLLITPTGTQDYYPAISGGINVLNYDANGVRQEVYNSDDEELKNRFLLVNTGRAHHSGLNNFEVLKNSINKNSKTIRALTAIKHISEEMYFRIRARDWDLLTPLFHRELEARLQLADAFSSPEIEEVQKIAISAGAEAVKICGAGGGGCVMVWCGKQNKSLIKLAIEKSGYQVLSAAPVGLQQTQFMAAPSINQINLI